MNYEAIARQLGNSGRCVCPNFLSPELTNDLREDLLRIQSTGAFKQAGISQGKEFQVRHLVRQDEIYWLEGKANVVQQLLWEKLASLQRALNRTLFMGLREFEGHYASYSENGFYKRHLDCFQRDDARMVSVILYLNRDWKFANGGQLRVFVGDTHIDIDPVGGTLVCFLSRELEHEVLLSHASRSSFVGWFKTS